MKKIVIVLFIALFSVSFLSAESMIVQDMQSFIGKKVTVWFKGKGKNRIRATLDVARENYLILKNGRDKYIIFYKAVKLIEYDY